MMVISEMQPHPLLLRKRLKFTIQEKGMLSAVSETEVSRKQGKFLKTTNSGKYKSELGGGSSRSNTYIVWIGQNPKSPTILRIPTPDSLSVCARNF
jgi:hypothetical protein